MQPPREAAARWVESALTATIPPGRDFYPATLEEHADSLLRIAETFEIATAELVEWIYTPAPAKEWTQAEFRAYCLQRTAA